MFTGIIEAVGEVVSISARSGDALRISVSVPSEWDDVEPSDSVSIDGICLTVAESAGGRLSFDAIRETVKRTTAASWQAGRRVNLERAVKVGGRLGGHILSGHIDGVARVEAVVDTGTGKEAAILPEKNLMRYVAEKGSVAVNGASLTVAGLEGDAFRVALIPETLGRTNLCSLKVGDEVNVEVDLLARYVERLISAGAEEGLSLDTLRRHGFAR